LIGPKRLLAQLEARETRSGAWLVTPAIEGEAFEVIDAALHYTTLRKVKANLAAGQIRAAWFLSKHIVDFYRNLLRSLDYLIRTTPKPHVVNISLGPSMKYAPIDPDDPIHFIVRNATIKGLFIVAAQGNEGCHVVTMH